MKAPQRCSTATAQHCCLRPAATRKAGRAYRCARRVTGHIAKQIKASGRGVQIPRPEAFIFFGRHARRKRLPSHLQVSAHFRHGVRDKGVGVLADIRFDQPARTHENAVFGKQAARRDPLEKRTVTQRKKRLPIRPRAEDSTCSVWIARPTASIRCPTDSKQNANGTGGERIRMVPPHFPALVTPHNPCTMLFYAGRAPAVHGRAARRAINAREFLPAPRARHACQPERAAQLGTPASLCGGAHPFLRECVRVQVVLLGQVRHVADRDSIPRRLDDRTRTRRPKRAAQLDAPDA